MVRRRAQEARAAGAMVEPTNGPSAPETPVAPPGPVPVSRDPVAHEAATLVALHRQRELLERSRDAAAGPIRLQIDAHIRRVEDSIRRREAHHRRGMSVVTTAIGVLAGTALILARQPGVSPLRTLWAEDGYFLRDAITAPDPTVLFRPLAGYLNLVPRLVAEIAANAPLAYAPVVMSGGAAVLAALLATFVFRATRGVIANPALRLWVAGLTLLLPTLGWESINNMSNIQVFLEYAAAWALLARPVRVADRAAGVAVVLAATLSSPLSILLAPLALVGRDRVVVAAGAIGFAVQAAVIVSAGGTHQPVHPDLALLPALYVLRVLLSAAFGVALGDRLWVALGHGVTLIGAAAAIAVAAYAATRPQRGTIALVMGSSVALFVVGFGLRWTHYLVPTPHSVGFSAARLTVVPALLVLTAIALLLDARHPRVDARHWTALVAGVLVVSVFVTGVDFLARGNHREAGPTWGAGLAAARPRCATQESVPVAITPPGWSIELPCRVVAAR